MLSHHTCTGLSLPCPHTPVVCSGSQVRAAGFVLDSPQAIVGCQTHDNLLAAWSVNWLTAVDLTFKGCCAVAAAVRWQVRTPCHLGRVLRTTTLGGNLVSVHSYGALVVWSEGHIVGTVDSPDAKMPNLYTADVVRLETSLLVAGGSPFGEVFVWNVLGGEPTNLRRVTRHWGAVYGCRLLKEILVTVSDDRRVIVTPTATDADLSSESTVLYGHNGRLWDVDAAPTTTGWLIATVGEDSQCLVWHLVEGKGSLLISWGGFGARGLRRVAMHTSVGEPHKKGLGTVHLAVGGENGEVVVRELSDDGEVNIQMDFGGVLKLKTTHDGIVILSTQGTLSHADGRNLLMGGAIPRTSFDIREGWAAFGLAFPGVEVCQLASGSSVVWEAFSSVRTDCCCIVDSKPTILLADFKGSLVLRTEAEVLGQLSLDTCPVEIAQPKNSWIGRGSRRRDPARVSVMLMDRDRVFIGDDVGNLHTVEVKDGLRLIHTLKGAHGRQKVMSLAIDGETLVSGGHDGRVCRVTRDLQTLSALFMTPIRGVVHYDPRNGMCLGFRGAFLLLKGPGGVVWERRLGSSKCQAALYEGSVYYQHDGLCKMKIPRTSTVRKPLHDREILQCLLVAGRIVTCGEDGSTMLLDENTLQPLHRVQSPVSVRCMCSLDKGLVFTAGSENTVQLLQVTHDGICVLHSLTLSSEDAALALHQRALCCGRSGPRTVLTGLSGGVVVELAVETDRLVYMGVQRHQSPVTAICGGQIFGHGDGSIQGKPAHLRGVMGIVRAGAYLLSVGDDGDIVVQTSAAVCRRQLSHGSVRCIIYVGLYLGRHLILCGDWTKTLFAMWLSDPSSIPDLPLVDEPGLETERAIEPNALCRFKLNVPDLSDITAEIRDDCLRAVAVGGSCAAQVLLFSFRH
ncbi:MAG: uncharacterized protein KVP18_001838 [Porospora cf. gigantea A]|uniref:uncharacterized protein n=2 Tax=Porospora cf. gigantea A TaxID=2853593 RepID=UPI00355A0DF3|nr:MAG: hypothetical protein KVP18_001838 [Porospora cf. gigantea A]